MSPEARVVLAANSLLEQALALAFSILLRRGRRGIIFSGFGKGRFGRSRRFDWGGSVSGRKRGIVRV